VTDGEAAGGTGGGGADATSDTRALEEPSEGDSLGTMASVLQALARAPGGGTTLAQGDRLGRYVVLSRIGSGGTGVVLSAYDPQLDRKVAIKLLRRDLAQSSSSSARERIEREARALAKLGHPNIVAVYDVGTVGEDVYIVMELVVGEPLREWVRAPQRTLDEILTAFAQAGAGLVAAHDAGLVHRDFKPDNALLGNDGRVRVADFGLVRGDGRLSTTASGSMPRLGTDAGTPSGDRVPTVPSRLPAAADEMPTWPVRGAKGTDAPDTADTAAVAADPTASHAAAAAAAAAVATDPTPSHAEPPVAEGERRVEAQLDTLPIAPGADLGHAPTITPGSTLTADGAFLGTPGYMAPEQLKSAHVDAHADQFAFCVALWEALYGVRPFRAVEVEPRLAEIVAGPRVPDKPPRSVPAWLRALLVRGLANDPAHRHPSLRALLDEIDRRRRPRRALAAGAIAAVAAAGLAVWITRAPTAPAVCSSAPRELARVWNPTRADDVLRAFSARGSAGPAVAATVRADLDAWSAGWIAQHTAACRATEVDKTQSPSLLDKRMACLRRLSSELDAVVTTLGRGDARSQEHADELVASIHAPSICGEVEELARTLSYPTDPAARRDIEEIEDELSTIKMGRYDRPLAELERDADALLARARAVGWPSILARALHARGDLCVTTDDHECAARLFREGVEAAIAASNDWDTIVFVGALAVEEARNDRRREAAVWSDVQVAMLARYPGNMEMRQQVDHDRASVLALLGRISEAVAAGREAVALIDRLPGRSDSDKAAARDTLGVALVQAAQYDEAIAMFTESAAKFDAIVRDGPSTARSLSNMSAALIYKGDLAAGCARASEALAIEEAWYGPDHISITDAMNNLGTCLMFSGKIEEARAHHQRALAITVKAYGEKSTEYGTALANMAGESSSLGDHTKALELGERSLAILEENLGKTNPKLTILLEILGYAYRHAGKLAEAEATLRRAIAINAATFPDGSASTANAHNELGLVMLARKDRAGAQATFETSVALVEKYPQTSPIVAAECRLQLAKLVRTSDPARARALAAKAHEQYAGLGEAFAAQAAEAAALAR
jgi:eukaryotic-like serine/threonine-protein kinase